MSKITATSDILKYMQEHDFITAKIAYDNFGVERLAGIIFNLRKRGYIIDTVEVNGITRYGAVAQYARYFLRGREDEQSNACN